MKAASIAIATLALSTGMNVAHATFMPWQEGLFFSDFDDPTAPAGFGLDDSGIYPYAGIFIGNVGKPGDSSDTINFRWPGLTTGKEISADFRVGFMLEGGASFGDGQDLTFAISDSESGTPIRTIVLTSADTGYAQPGFVFDGRAYSMSVTPSGLTQGQSFNYSIDFMLTPVPEPEIASMLGIGILALLLSSRRKCCPTRRRWKLQDPAA